MDKFLEKYCFEVFDDGEWTIHLKERNNIHLGEPNMKVWVCLNGREVAQYSDKFRGYGIYADREVMIPKEVRKKALKTWKELCEGYYSEARLQKLREEFISRHCAILL